MSAFYNPESTEKKTYASVRAVITHKYCECGGPLTTVEERRPHGRYEVPEYLHTCADCDNEYFFEVIYPRKELEYSPYPPPQSPSSYDLPEGFIPELGCTVRTCLDCGCLVAGGPTRCGRCVDNIPDGK